MKRLIIIFALAMCSCGNQKDNVIKIGASSIPHAEILECAKSELKGYSLEVKIYDDYVTPNISLADGDIDANYFQHEPYLIDFNESHGTDISMIGKVHFEPMGIYSYSLKDATKESPRIVIPIDESNGARARKLLADNSIEGKITEADAATIPLLLPDFDYACINGNYALSAKVTDKCIITEPTDGETAKRNANGIAVRRKDAESPWAKALLEAVTSEKVRKFIVDKYGSAVLPVF